MISKIFNKELREQFFSNYFVWVYVFFIASIFFVSTNLHKNFYYIFVIAPFLLTVNFRDIKIIANSKIFIITFAYCLYMVMSLGWSKGVDGGDSIEVIRKALIVITFLSITAYVFFRNIKFINVLYKYICLSAGVWAVIYILLFCYNNSTGRLNGFGALKNPIMAANCYSVAVLLIFFSYLINHEITFYRKVLYMLTMLVCVVFVVLTQSRGPLLALLSVLMISSVLVRPKYVLWVFGGCCIPLAAVFLSGYVDFYSLISRADSYRLTIWSQSWDLFLRQPWFGYGIRGDRPDIIITLLPERITARHSHNLFISTMLDGGVFALLLIVALICSAAYWALKVYRKNGDITLFALVAFAFLANLTDGKTPIVSPNYQWLYFWLPIGLAAAYELILREQNFPKAEAEVLINSEIRS